MGRHWANANGEPVDDVSHFRSFLRYPSMYKNIRIYQIYRYKWVCAHPQILLATVCITHRFFAFTTTATSSKIIKVYSIHGAVTWISVYLFQGVCRCGSVVFPARAYKDHANTGRFRRAEAQTSWRVTPLTRRFASVLVACSME